MNVDTGAFEAITAQVAALTARVADLETREVAREAAAEVICGGPDGVRARQQRIEIMQALFDAGRDRTRRDLGLPALPAVRSAGGDRPRHLQPVRDAQ